MDNNSHNPEYGRYAAQSNLFSKYFPNVSSVIQFCFDMIAEVAREHVIHEFNDFLTKCCSDLESVDRIYQSVAADAGGSSLHLQNPVVVDPVARENLSLADLIISNHEELRKTMLTLGFLVEEMDLLTEELGSFYHPLLYYGEGLDDVLLQRGEAHTCAGRMLEPLHKLLDCVTHSYKVVKNVLTQLSRLHCSPNSGPKYFDVGECHFKIVFERLGNVLVTIFLFFIVLLNSISINLFQASLVTLDSIINRNGLLREHISQFQHVIRSVQHNATNFDTTPEDLQLLDLSMDEITEKALSGTLFLRCVSQGFPASTSSTNKAFLDEVAANIKGFLEELCFRLEKDGEADSVDNLRKFLAVVCLHVLHGHLGLKVDRKQLKTILDVARNSIVAVPLTGSCLWFPDQFLSLYLPRGDRAVDAKTLEAIAAARSQFLRNRAGQLAKDLPAWNVKILVWLGRLAGVGRTSQEELTDQCVLMLQGMRYAARLSASVRLVLNLHLAIQPVISKTTVLAAFQTFELIKILQVTMEKQLNVCPQAWIHLQQQLRRSVLDTIQAGIKKVSAAAAQPSARGRTIVESLKLAQRVLSGPCTRPRVSIARLSLAVACNASFRDEELPLLAQRLQKMELLAGGIRERVKDLADCEVFYWHKALLHTYLAEAGQRHFEPNRLGYALLAVHDCRDALRRAIHVEEPQEMLVKKHEAFVRRALDRHILEPLCTAVETELRIQSHSNLSASLGTGPDRSPNSVSTMPRQLKGQLLLGQHERLNVPAHVEHYLGQTFYNLAALASHDWRKYSQMRLLAGLIFGLSPLPDRLPSQTQEQGLDVLEIMRNIHLFVARFGYNLNNQFFVEQSSSSKHLSTIGIKVRHPHLAVRIVFEISIFSIFSTPPIPSGRTAPASSTRPSISPTNSCGRNSSSFLSEFRPDEIARHKVDFTIFYFPQRFLYDEQIKSRLMKDVRYLREFSAGDGGGGSKETAKYPYERAEKFHRGIRKLGLNSLGQSYLDQFRLLVTQLGNALGYVRMLRSGSIHCSAESCGIAIQNFLCFSR